MKKLKRKDYIVYGIVVFIFLVFIITFKLTHKTNKDNTTNNEYLTVTNASKFFTLEGCVNKYVNALYSKNSDDLMKLLDDSYVKDNNITKDNILDKLGALNGIYSFKSKKIYYEKLDSKYEKYYIYGLLQKDVLDTYDLGTDYYLILIVNTNKNTFHVVPYDGAIFKEEV